MKDRFKFRVFDYDKNKMVYFSDLFSVVKPHHDRSSMPNYYNDYKYHKTGEYMQSTGLKDKNGKLIYEGDVLKVVGKQTEEIIGCVQWLDDFCKFSLNIANKKEGKYQSCEIFCEFDYLPETEREIIGNIYENKELLGVE